LYRAWARIAARDCHASGVRTALVTALLVFVLCPVAFAQGTLSEAAGALRDTPVYVDPDAEQPLSDQEAEALKAAIRERGAGPLYVAVLPESATDEAGGDPSAALRELALSVGEPGTYAGVFGNTLRAGSADVLDEGEAGRLATESVEAERGNGTAAVLNDFVRRVGEARANGGSGGDSRGGGGFPWLVLILLAVPLALFGVSRRTRHKREQADLAEVKKAAREDLVALGEDIRALDVDVQMPDADPEARSRYNQAVERYQEADQAFAAARRPRDMETVTSLLEEGRWAMSAAKARFAGEPEPERRAPCFFDPRHGPSVEDLDWAPPGGEPRPVPVCAADAQRIKDGEEPGMREVEVNGRSVPYWQAGPAFGPWAGGFYGGGLLPGLFVGSMLGGGFGFGGYENADASADSGDFGDFGGGDFGGFGGGDFGGGGDF
jgi:hypothetical protein